MRTGRALIGRFGAEDGMTLIELLVAMLILVIVIGPITNALIGMSRTSNDVEANSALVTQTRAGVDELVSDLREAYTAQASVAPIITMTSTQLTFYVPDEQTPFHLLKVGYQLSGGNLQRAQESSTDTGGPPWQWPTPDALGAWQTVASSVSNASVFSYQQANGTTATTPAQVSRVIVTVTSKGQGGQSTSYSASATIRGSQAAAL
jgi:prepilin-type N-terminal cleavage/methylation domain-containing protein